MTTDEGRAPTDLGSDDAPEVIGPLPALPPVPGGSPAVPGGSPTPPTARVWPDAVIAVTAERQRGLIARRQLLALGLSPKAIDRAVARGRLWPVHRGIYTVGQRALPSGATEFAAILAVGDGAVISHQAAAALHRLSRSHQRST